MSDYNKTNKLFDELSRISKEYNIIFLTAQQPQRNHSGHSRIMRLSPHTGNSRNIEFLPMDHINII
jgi:hypothetical protein